MPLSFRDVVKEHFGAIAQHHGLRLAYESETRLEYESDRAKMLVIFDNERSYELAVAFALVGSNVDEPPYSLAEVLRLQKHPEGTSIEGQQFHAQGSLNEAVRKAACLTSEFASEQLYGNAAAFQELAKQRAAEATAYGLSRDLRAARNEADRAWRAKDFATVVSVYRPFRAYLSPSELKRLEFAGAHIDQKLKGGHRD